MKHDAVILVMGEMNEQKMLFFYRKSILTRFDKKSVNSCAKNWYGYCTWSILMLAGILDLYLKVHFSGDSCTVRITWPNLSWKNNNYSSCGNPIRVKLVAFERKLIAKQICETLVPKYGPISVFIQCSLGWKNELLSRGLKLRIPRMSTHTNIVPKYQSDGS